MEQISQQFPEAQPLASPPARSPHWLLIVVVILVFLLILGLGGYYYFEMYSPAQYAKAVVPLYDKIRSQPVVTGNLTGNNTYEDVLIILDQYEASLTQTHNELSNLKPSPVLTMPSFLTNTERSKQIQEDFTKILEVFISNIARAKKQAQVMIKAKELFLLLRPELTDYPPKAVPEGQPAPSSPATNTVGEFLAVWESRIPQAKEVAQELFSEPVDLGDVSFDELKQLWQETEQGLDALLPFLKKQDPELPFSQLQKIVPESDKAVFDKVDKVDEFLPMLESVLIRNSAENVLKYPFTAGSTQSELSVRGARLDAAIKDIKAKYAKL